MRFDCISRKVCDLIIYELIDGELKPYLSKTGKRFKNRTKDQQHRNTERMKRKTNYQIYNSTRWHRLSKAIMKRDPICQNCLREYKAGKRKLENVNLTQSVDHIVKVNDDKSKIWDPSNLQGLCWSCHHKKDGNLFSSRHVKDYK